jgi:hypothetical protein
MNPYEHSTILQPEPDKAGRMFPQSIAEGVASAGIWIILIGSVYIILPWFQAICWGFGIDIGPLATLVLVHARLLLLLIGIAAGASLAAMQSRRWYLFVLIWLPMILIGVLLRIVGPSLVKLLNHLA